jgi:RNA polymerase sigma factor (sigma-70 family)
MARPRPRRKKDHVAHSQLPDVTGEQMVEPSRGENWPSGAGTVEFEPTFIDLYRELQVPMVRLAWALTGSESTAQDLVHDVFIRTHAHWHRIEHPRSYLRKAVVNACRSASRRAKRERSVEALFVVEEARLEADEMFDALSSLPYRQRAALVLQFYEGLPQSEIATLLRCREGTVASLVHRGLTQLRRVIEQ